MKHLAVRLPLLLCLLCAVPLFAQTADVSGTVTDPSGATVVGAKVRLVNQATLVQRNVTTNSQGIFIAPFISPGFYEVFVDAPGFSTEVIRDIKIDVAAKINLPVHLEVGRQDQTVRVDGSGLILNTVDASVSTVIDRKFVENMPLNGQSFQDLISLTPGVVTQSPQASAGYSAIGQSGDFSVNGQRTESNYYMVDGVAGNTASGNGAGTPQAGNSGSVAASTVLGTTQSLVSVDALQEFRVESSTYSAEYGRSPGGQFSFATRSGTNEIHGSAFDYLRNNYFDANDWFNDHYDQPISPLRQNDFGGTFGGPVYVPKLYHGREKSFFFVSYEGLRLTLPQAASLEYVPSISLRQSAPIALQPILNAYPTPTGTEIVDSTGNPTGLSPFTLPYSSPSQIDSTSVRFDQVLSSKARLFFRFGNTPSSTTTRILSAVTQNKVNGQTYTLGATYQISNRMTDEFRLGYDRSDSSQDGSIDDFGGAAPIDLAQRMGIGGYGSAFPGFFFFVSGVGSSELSVGNTANRGRQWNVIDTISITKKSHQLRFGFDYRRIRSPLTPPSPYVVGLYEGEQEVLSNDALYVDVDKTNPATPIFNELAAFLQDEWHVAPRISLALGLRWEIDPAPSTADGEDAYTVLGNIQDPTSLYLAPRGTALWQTPWANLAPRIGIAWTARDTPGWQTVLRTGGGAFFDTDDEEASLGFHALGFGAYQLYFDSALPVVASQLNFPITVAPPYATVVAFPQHLQLPYTLQWNVSLEQALGLPQAVTISYVGANGRRLPQNQLLSVGSLNPAFGTIEYPPGGVTSNYQALQIQFQRSVSRGLHALASYSWSHSLDYGSNDSAEPLIRGNSDFDVRNNLQAGMSWDLPVAKAKSLFQDLWSNWGIDGRLMVRSAFPITLSGNYLTDPATGLGYYGNVDLVPSQPIYLHGSQYPGDRAVNPAAFQFPIETTDPGDAPRNFVRGFGAGQLNLAAHRAFPIAERLQLQFRAEAFNLLNHPNFGYVDPNLTDAAFGQATMMLNSSLGTMASQYQQGGPRSMQFALKFTF